MVTMGNPVIYTILQFKKVKKISLTDLSHEVLYSRHTVDSENVDLGRAKSLMCYKRYIKTQVYSEMLNQLSFVGLRWARVYG